MQKLSLDTVNTIVAWKKQNIISDARFHQLLDIIHSDPIFQEEPCCELVTDVEPLLTTPVKLKPKDLYKNMTATELIREIEVLTTLQNLCISTNRFDKFGTLIEAALKELNLRGDAILEQVQFDYVDGTAIC